MNHEHLTMRDHDDARRRPFWLGVVLATSALLIVAVATSAAGRDPAIVLELPRAVPVEDAAPATAVPTTAPPTIATPTIAPVASPPPPTPPPPAPNDADVAPEEALRELASIGRAVSPIVRVASGTYALTTVTGDAQLMAWDGTAWDRRESIPTPTGVQEIEATDVTGDAATDFVIKLRGGRDAAGVYANAGGRWRLVPFVGPSGSSTFVDGLDVSGGRLRSDPLDGTDRPAQWRWNGRAFTIR